MAGLARGAFGRFIWAAQRALPRLERRYAQLSSSTALAPREDSGGQAQLLEGYYTDLAATAAALPPVRFEVRVAADGCPPEHLTEALRSITWQLHPHWRARLECRHPAQREICEGFVQSDPRRFSLVGDTAERASTHADGPDAEFIVLLDPHDRLLPNALAEAARWLTAWRRADEPEPALIYCDSRAIDAQGVPRGEPQFRPGWSPLLLLGDSYVGRLLIVAREVATGVGELRPSWTTALEATRAPSAVVRHIPHVLYQEREGLPPSPAAMAAVDGFCDTRGWTRPERTAGGPIRFAVSQPQPPVSVVVPTRDGGDVFARCMESVMSRTDYSHREVVIVDNDTSEPGSVRYLHELSQRQGVRVLSHPGSFNFAAMNNRAVHLAAGSAVVLLNNDTEVITPDWLETLVGLAQLPGVGAVGPQLLYPDGRIQHAGLVGMAEQGTGHEFVAAEPGTTTPAHLLGSTHEVLAVTGACLAVAKEHYEEVGGLDEALLPNDSGDVDFCLRLRERGLVNVYTPAAVLSHHESVTRGRSFRSFERFQLLRRWPQDLLNDPYLNPNFAKSTRLTPDYRFPVADVPDTVMQRWLAGGSVLADSHNDSHRQS